MRSEDFLLSKDLPALFFKIILWFFDIKFVIVSLSKTLIIITSTYWVLIEALTLIALRWTLTTQWTISTIIMPPSSTRKLRFGDIGWLVWSQTAPLVAVLGFRLRCAIPETLCFQPLYSRHHLAVLVFSYPQRAITGNADLPLESVFLFHFCHLFCPSPIDLLWQIYHKLGSLQITEIYFSYFWILGSPRSRSQQIRCLVRAHFLLHR